MAKKPSWANLLISHLVSEGLQLALMLAPHLGLLQTQLAAQLLLLLPLPLRSCNCVISNYVLVHG